MAKKAGTMAKKAKDETLAKCGLAVRTRDQKKRRNKIDKFHRLMEDRVHNRLSKQVVASKKVDGKLIGEMVWDTMEAEGLQRLSAKWWRETLARYEQNVSALAAFELEDKDQKVAEKLVNAMDKACAVDNKTRDNEDLLMLLKYGAPLNQKDSQSGQLQFRKNVCNPK